MDNTQTFTEKKLTVDQLSKFEATTEYPYMELKLEKGKTITAKFINFLDAKDISSFNQLFQEKYSNTYIFIMSIDHSITFKVSRYPVNYNFGLLIEKKQKIVPDEITQVKVAHLIAQAADILKEHFWRFV